MKKLTPAMKKAIQWLQDRGGNGIIDSRAKMIAEGERADFDPSTWLRLISNGNLECVNKRFFLTYK